MISNELCVGWLVVCVCVFVYVCVLRPCVASVRVFVCVVTRSSFSLVVTCPQPKFILDMIDTQAAGDLDVVSGTRYRGGGGIHGWSMFRKFTSRVAHTLATLLFNPQASDLTGSFRLYKKPVLQAVMPLVVAKGQLAVVCARARVVKTAGRKLRSLRTGCAVVSHLTGYTFQMEVLVRSRHMGFSIGEVPITFVDRIFGESKLGPGEIVSCVVLVVCAVLPVAPPVTGFTFACAPRYLKGCGSLFLDL